MTPEQKKDELIGLFSTGTMFIGEVIDESMEFAAPHWISVEESLPKHCDWVLAWIRYHSMITAEYPKVVHFEGIRWVDHLSGNPLNEYESVQFWMPIPAAPKKGGKQ